MASTSVAAFAAAATSPNVTAAGRSRVAADQQAYIADLQQKLARRENAMAQLAKDTETLQQLIQNLENNPQPQGNGTKSPIKVDSTPSSTPSPLANSIMSLTHERIELSHQIEAERMKRGLLAQNTHEVAQYIELSVKEAIATEAIRASQLDGIRPLQSLSLLTQLQKQTVQDLQQAQRQREELVANVQHVSQELVEVAQRSHAQIPTIRAVSQQHIHHLDQDWQKERSALHKEYRRLLAINQEQRYHLHRGSMKQEVEEEKPWVVGEIKDLKAHQAELLKQIQNIRLRQKDVQRQHKVILESYSDEDQAFAQLKLNRVDELTLLKQQQVLLIEPNTSQPEATEQQEQIEGEAGDETSHDMIIGDDE